MRIKKGKRIIFCFFYLFSCFLLFSQEIKINQKEGILQEKIRDHITFQKFKKFQPDLSQAVISRLTKLIIHGDRVFILDKRQARIFVFDKKANYLYSIGRPGQGPGDLEHPDDFIISEEGTVYVVNSMAERIEVFLIKGDFQRRIKLVLPEEIFYSNPSCLLINSNKQFFIAYKLSSHLIDLYDYQGNYIRNLLKREEPILVPGQNLGNSSQILFFNKSNKVLHFNYFSGIFTILSKEGEVETVFSSFDKAHTREVTRLKRNLEEKRRTKKPGIRISDYQIWSNCWIDKNDIIYVFLMFKNKDELQQMFVFSPEGIFLYRTTIPYFKGIRVDKAFCYGDDFVFISRDQEIFIAKKED